MFLCQSGSGEKHECSKGSLSAWILSLNVMWIPT